MLLSFILFWMVVPVGTHASDERILQLNEISFEPATYSSNVGDSGIFTWWLPAGADEYILPLSAGVVVDTSQKELMRWLRQGSPWPLSELPAIGLRYGDQMAVVIVPWPHYAELIVEDRLGIRFSFPRERERATPIEIVTMRRSAEPLEVARAFREWRQTADSTGGIPRPRTLNQKIYELDNAARLLGAPHFYLWGSALFSRHDVPKNKWLAFARALCTASSSGFGGRLVVSFTVEQRSALQDLANAEWPMDYLTVTVAGAIDTVLSDPDLLYLGPETPAAAVVQSNKRALSQAFGNFLNPMETWGDGFSASILEALHHSGIERALLLLSDLYSRTPRPDMAALADEFGYLVGPYDSYHTVHSPSADSDSTWETAQFDLAAYEAGRVVNADGSGNGGFLGRGYHFSPEAAWPYVQQRVGEIVTHTSFSAWFIDCDATAECFDDFSREHSATRVDDITLRRQRLSWLESENNMVVGSEGGSVLFSDVIHFGHGVHTPYIGHLDPSFRDRGSPHYLGRHWPPDTPEQSFKSVPIPPSLVVPYFDPTVRIPLYQAALGDEIIATHHWSFDSLKFENVKGTRELLEILYMVPPLYHINRETWPERREPILEYLAFWGPLHRELAPVPLTGFDYLSDDRLVQRTTFQTEEGEVKITVNFGGKSQKGYPAYSATVSGPISVSRRVYRVSP